jgi:elongation factor P
VPSQANALDLRKGDLVTYQGRMCTVIHWNILRNDRRQFVQMKVRDLATGRVSEMKEHGDTKFEVFENSKIDVAHSYRDGNDEVFYSPDGEEYRVPHAAAEEALVWKCDAYKGLLVDGRLLAISLPQSVVATVTETAPPMKGGGSGTKDAVLDNGVKVRVSLLTAVGDRVRLDPETLEFKERV